MPLFDLLKANVPGTGVGGRWQAETSGRYGNETGWAPPWKVSRRRVCGVEWALGLALASLAVCTTPAFALRCGSHAVSEGDRKVEVLARCGEPAWVDQRLEESSVRVFRDTFEGGLAGEERVTRVIEEWAYNFGPSRLLYFLTFADGKLVKVETAGYGYTDGAPRSPGAECWGRSVARGRRKLEVLQTCGHPASVDVREVERTRSFADRRFKQLTERRASVAVEEWTYNFGPNRLLYVFTFENGRVVDVQTGGYGF